VSEGLCGKEYPKMTYLGLWLPLRKDTFYGTAAYNGSADTQNSDLH